MAVRHITDIDAFFADEAMQPILDAFFKEAFGRSITLTQFKILLDRKRYTNLFHLIITRHNLDAFKRFMKEFHISPNATITHGAGQPPMPLLFRFLSVDGPAYPEFARALLAMGADVHIINPYTKLNALMTAAQNGNLEGVRYLLTRTNIDPKAITFNPSHRGETAYNIALKTHNFDSKAIQDLLSAVTPDTSFKANEANLAATKARLQPYRKNIIGLARKKGIPANVIKYGIGPFLTSGPRLPGVRVAPNEVGLERVDPSLFQKSRKRRGGYRKPRKDRKTRSRK
jgi:ankyrin repeat protein